MSKRQTSNGHRATSRVDRALTHVGHPVRLFILEHALRGRISPRELADKAAGRYSLGTISYHVRTLHDDKLLKLAATRQVRGAIAHFYEPTKRAEALMATISVDAEHDEWVERAGSVVLAYATANGATPDEIEQLLDALPHTSLDALVRDALDGIRSHA